MSSISKPGSLGDRLKRLRENRAFKTSINHFTGEKPCDISFEDYVPENRAEALNITSNGPKLIELPPWKKSAEFTYKRTCLFDFHSPLMVNEGADTAHDFTAEKDSLVFIDTETTGLSGGAGTLIFLIGFGRFTPQGFAVEQIFLSDFPGEPLFLAEIYKSFQEGTYVTYNGSSFDLPLLRTRLNLNGMIFNLQSHLDLLYPVRRIWKKRIGRCRLCDIERFILSLERKDDLPGFEVPERYFRFLKEKDPSLLDQVFSHHLQDIVSLGLLYSKLEEMLYHPWSVHKADRLAWALELLKGEGKQKKKGEKLLCIEYQAGNLYAGYHLACHLKKLGRVHEAAVIWSNLWNQNKHILSHDPADKNDLQATFEDPVSMNRLLLVCSIELAKYLEHQKKDYTEALVIVNNLLSASGINKTYEYLHQLNHRKERLNRKLDRNIAS